MEREYVDRIVSSLFSLTVLDYFHYYYYYYIGYFGNPYETDSRRRSQDGGGIGRGDHFLSYKFIKRITERRANFTKQLLIAS